MALCKACGKEPRRGISTLCAGCENARRRQWRNDEKNGKRKVTICPHCRTRLREPGGSYCTTCAAEYRRVLALRKQGVNVTWGNTRKVLRDPDTKYCNSCGRVLVRTLFYNDKSKKDGLKSYCKLCCNLSNRAWARRHRAQVKACQKRYYRNHASEVCERSRRWRLRQRQKHVNKLLGVSEK